MSGGASNALKSGKLIAIANKLKALEKAGDLSDTLKKLVGKNSRFAKQLDEFVDDERRGHKSPPSPVNTETEAGPKKKFGIGAGVPVEFEDLAEKARDARQLLAVKGLNSKMRKKFKKGKGNIAVGELDTGGKKDRYTGFSGEQDVEGFVEFVPNDKRELQTGPAKTPGKNGKIFMRDVDAEAKILEKIIQATSPNAKGTLRLYTELPTCRACSRLIENFLKHRPYMSVELGWDGGKISFPARRSGE